MEKGKLGFAIAFIAVILAGTALRSLTLRFNSFMEPDVYIYYAVAVQTLANHLQITSLHSGVPPQPFAERPGLIYFSVIPAFLLHIPIATIILYLPILFGILEMLCVYLLAFRLMGSKWTGLLAMLLFAILNAAILKNSGGEWRGETFVPLFVLVMGLAFTMKRSWLGLPLALAMLGLSLWTWSAGVYAIPIAIAFIAISLIAKLPERHPLQRRIAIGIIMAVFAISALLYVGIPSGIDQSTILEEAPFNILSMLATSGLVLLLALMGIWYSFLRLKELGETQQKALFAVLAVFAVTFGLQLSEIRWSILLAAPACILAAYGLWQLSRIFSSRPLALLIIVIILMLSFLVMEKPVFSPGGITPSLIQSAEWLGANTPQNATILTFWPDGSVVEAIANRSVLSDSMSASGEYAETFPRFLYAKAGNFSMLDSSRPDYLLVRYFWLNETPTIKSEGNLPQNTSLFDTNLYILEKRIAANYSGNGISLSLVYENNDSLVYKVSAIK